MTPSHWIFTADDPAFTIEAVKDHLFCEHIKPEGPVLALIEGGKA